MDVADDELIRLDDDPSPGFPDRCSIGDTVSFGLVEYRESGGAGMFQIGQEYRRQEIHDLIGGQRQGGISTPAKHAVVLLFTGSTGERHGYTDGWTNDIFHYFGEGQSGDMQLIRGNKAIRDHASDGKELHLFRQKGRGIVEYVGQFRYLGHRIEKGPDTEGKIRQSIVFELAPISSAPQSTA
jgi:5-methylcytosine-specific restriction protein A